MQGSIDFDDEILQVSGMRGEQASLFDEVGDEVRADEMGIGEVE